LAADVYSVTQRVPALLRVVGLQAICALSVGAAVPAQAQNYPTRSVELVVPFAAGGGTDLLARLVAEGLGKRLGQSFVPLNRPGGNTNTGTLQVVKSAPDGHTLVMASIGLAANPSLYRKLAFDPLADLAPISLLANSPTVLVVPPDLPVNTAAEFIAHLKAHPGALNYASYGAGSGPHLAAELFRSMTGVDFVHVPYSGGGPAAVGVMGNNVQMLFASVLPVLGLVRSGKLKAIAIASQARSPLLPDVPTFKEGGLDYRTGTWFGLLAPARTPDTIVETLYKQVTDVLGAPSVRDRIVEQGAEVVGNTPGEFRAFLKEETERLAVVVRNAKMQLD
jgi:tripartite-type tricarboxylate transporter receptor subunit TctC